MTPGIPARIHELVRVRARELGREVASDDLFLLALTELDEDDMARRALAAEGLTTERLVPEIRTWGDRAVDAHACLTFAPAYYSIQGRAEGFAAALSDGRIRSEHVLVSVVWDPMSHSSHLLWRLGVKREAIVEQLRAHGAQVPAAALPLQQTIEYGERVWFERRHVAQVLEHLRLNLPPGTVWGFNYEDDRAWAHGEANIDMEQHVKAALSGSHN
jgi:hypothetical protein